MTDPTFTDRDESAGYPEVVDDDSPERERTPEPEGPALGMTEGYAGADAVGTTVDEEIQGESLDDKLDRETPEPAVDPTRPMTPDEPQDGTGGLGAEQPAGQLVAPDAGGAPDEEKDEVAEEVPGDAGSPEEQAMRVEEGPA